MDQWIIAALPRGRVLDDVHLHFEGQHAEHRIGLLHSNLILAWISTPQAIRSVTLMEWPSTASRRLSESSPILFSKISSPAWFFTDSE